MRRTRALGHALAYVAELAASMSAQGKRRLPTVKHLAGSAGVSPVTMWKAVQELKRQGYLEVVHGRGTFVVSAPVPQEPTEVARDKAPPRLSRKRRWQELCERFQKGMLDGTYPPGDILPSPKRLADEYGVCFRTLKRALNSLVADGSLEHYKRGYRVPPFLSETSRGRVVLIARGAQRQELDFVTARTAGHFHWLEMECFRAGLNLVVRPFHYADNRICVDGQRPAQFVQAMQEEPVLGYIVWTIVMGPRGTRDLVSALAATGKPVAALDEVGNAALLPLLERYRNLKVLSMAHSVASGRSVGRHLLGLGHRKISFLCPYPVGSLYETRVAGLREAFLGTGLEDAVEVYAPGGEDEPERPAQPRSDPSPIGGDSVPDGRSQQPVQSGAPMGRSVEALRVLLDTEGEWPATRRVLGPLMESALQDEERTAWVGASDEVAFECTDFLVRNGYSVPGQKSVIGFDDSQAASVRRLSSYSFNGPAVMRALLGHILDTGPLRRSSRRREPVEIDGFVVRRRSTGPPPVSTRR